MGVGLVAASHFAVVRFITASNAAIIDIVEIVDIVAILDSVDIVDIAAIFRYCR